jgi:hypothetical protein
MKVGDKVVWTSQAAGYTRTKRGVIIAVVPAKNDPRRFMPAGCKLDGPGLSRDHESYLVRSDRRGLYWPRVSALKPVGPPAYEEKVYRILRDYQDGKFDDGCVSAGRLTPALTMAYDRIVAAVRAAGGES